MHDPMTVAFDIRSPIKRKHKMFPKGYRNTLATVWHVDPESDGSDDSCGWSRPRLTKLQRERVEWLAKDEASKPWFRAKRAKTHDGPANAESLMRGLILTLARVLDVRVSWLEAAEWASVYIHNPGDNFRSGLCLMPGWHTNSKEDSEYWREEAAKELFYSVASEILRRKRPWYRHPRWHVWHWKLQIPVIQNLKRWLFSRCATCGNRFKLGESPVTNSWHGTGPLWFRSERDVHHSDCERAGRGTEASPS